MRIQHNISALNTHRNLAFNNTQTSKSLEKLSSGFKINRAGDDAAGLAISEKMRGQIRGLDMASKNAQDGISLIQTTEGALNETHSILQRMRELAVQAGNDTNTETDRGEIQKEINQLTSEINRIGNTTEFNTKKLLNGELSDKSVVTKGDPGTQVSKDFAVTQDVTVGTNPTTWGAGGKQVDTKTDITFTGKASNDMDWAALDATKTNTLTITKDATSGEMKVSVQAEAGAKTLTIDSKAMSFDNATNTYTFDQDGIKFSLTADQVNNWKAGETATVDLNKGATTGTVNATAASIDLADETVALGAVGGTGTAGITNFKVDGASKELLAGVASAEISFAGGKVTVDLKDSAGNSINKSEYSHTAGTPFKYNENGVSFDLSLDAGVTSLGVTKIDLKTESKTTTVGATPDTTEDRSLKFQIGANENQALTVAIEDMRAAALGIVGTGEGFVSEANVNNGTDAKNVENALDLSSHDSAASAVTTLDKAINKVSSERAKLGAVQNRLEHTINNLGASSENLTAAESRIRDTDMAASMMEFTKNNILTQAAQSMLAQANQQPQGVLQLLG